MPTYWGLGDSLIGERVASHFRKINPKGQLNTGFFKDRCFEAKLYGNVFCVIEKPLTAKIQVERTNIYKNQGDSIKGEKIITQFGSQRKIRITKGSSSHRIQNCIFEDKVYCVVDLPLVKINS